MASRAHNDVLEATWSLGAHIDIFIYIYIYIYIRRCLISNCFYGPLYASHPPYCSGQLDVIQHSNH